jgi:F420-dependent oxidoreductase-like protein
MRVSVSITNFSWNGEGLMPGLLSVAEAADSEGLDTLWVADHLMQADPASRVDEPMLEAYTTLAYLAARTTRIRLGTMVTAATFRAPSLVVKTVTTLDVLSGGRAWLGLGAGYQQDEADAMGLNLPPVPERYDALTDILELAEQMWAGDASAFAGRTVDAEHPVASPAPATRPHPPVLIGGTGKKRTLRLVAEHADACNLFDIPDGGTAVREQLAALAEHCADVGRDYDDIDRTISTSIDASEPVASVVDRFARLADLGITHAVTIARGRPLTTRDVSTLAEAASRLGTPG